MTSVLTDPATLTIRRPTAAPVDAPSAPTFDVGTPLAGLTVGLRTDGAWRSWQLIAGEWEKFLTRDGAAGALTIKTNAQIGREGTQDRRDIDAWSDQIDFGIVGLGTCGSCTSFSVADAVAAEQHQKPVIVVVCSEFETHAHNMATHLGHHDLRVLVLPYPLEARPDDELAQIAVEYYPKALALLGVTA